MDIIVAYWELEIVCQKSFLIKLLRNNCSLIYCTYPPFLQSFWHKCSLARDRQLSIEFASFLLLPVKLRVRGVPNGN